MKINPGSTIPINTPSDFECVACDLLNDFIMSYSLENGCIGYVSYHDGIECISAKGERLYERYQMRLFAIGQRLFSGQDMNIEASVMHDSESDYSDYNEHPDFERCPACGGREGQHKAACPEDDAIFY